MADWPQYEGTEGVPMRDKTDLEVAATRFGDLNEEIARCQREIDDVAEAWQRANVRMDELLKDRAEIRDVIKKHVDSAAGDPRSPNKKPFSADDGPVRISGRQNRDADRPEPLRTEKRGY